MESAADPDPGPPGAPAPGRLGRPARAGLAAAALLALAWFALHLAVDRPAVRDRVHARATDLLRARLGPADLGEEVEIDWAFRAWLGPLRVPAATRGAEPLLEVERIRVRASLLSALSGRLEPASVTLYDVRLAPGEHGQELVAALDRWRSRKAPAGPTAPARRSRDPVIQVRRFTLAVPWRGRTLRLGPIDARLERRGGADGDPLEADAWLPGGGHFEVRLQRSPSPEPGWAFLVTGSLGPADLAAPALTSGLRAEEGDLSLEVSGLATGTGGRATVRGELSRLRLRGDRLGPEPIGPLSARGQAELAWALAPRQLELRHGQVELLGPLRLEAEGALQLGADPSFALSVTVPPVDYRALVTGLPAALAPPLAAPRPPGCFGGALRLSGPLTPLVGWTVMARLDLGAMRAESAAGPPSPLLSPFVAYPDGDAGGAIRMGPSSATFVPLAELPDHVIRAVTTAEDAGFFGHQGFDFAELLDALAADAQAGRVVRGGSTISQQLAKNLYLSRDRTLARKAREALVTVALEASLPKARLLELYLNLIEWAPGVHGIGAAAHHYFGTDARRLTPRQACFLAAIIPGPNRAHRLVAAGLGDQAYRARADDLLLRLGGFQVISDAALQVALEEPLRFAFGAPAPRQAPAATPEAVPGGDGGPIEDEPPPGPERAASPAPPAAAP